MKRKFLFWSIILGMLWSSMTVHAGKIPLTEENFDYIWYANQNPDLKAAYGYDKAQLYLQYTTLGKDEGRTARMAKDSLITKENFDYVKYAKEYPDVANVVGTGLDELWGHYQTTGKIEGRRIYSTSEEINGMITAYGVIENITNDSMGEREKVKAVHDWMCSNIDYDYDNYLNGTIPISSRNVNGVLSTGKAVCEGYAVVFRTFMDILGIECELVIGEADNGVSVGGHAWNQVKIGGSWYNVDVTWDDPIYTYNGKRMQHTRYSYFLISNAQINKDHMTKQVVHDC